MNIKHIGFFGLAALTLTFFASCGEEREFLYDGPNFITFIDSTRKVSEVGDDGRTGLISVDVALGTAHSNTGIRVNFTATPNENLTIGTAPGQLELITEGITTIPAGESFGQIDLRFNNDNDQLPAGIRRVLTLELTGTSLPGYVVGYPSVSPDYTFGRVFQLEIIDDDCPATMRGRWRNRNTTFTDPETESQYPAQIITINGEPNSNGSNITIPDFMAVPLQDNEDPNVERASFAATVQIVGNTGIVSGDPTDYDLTVTLEDGTEQNLSITIDIVEGASIWNKCSNTMTITYDYQGAGDRGTGRATNEFSYIGQ